MAVMALSLKFELNINCEQVNCYEYISMYLSHTSSKEGLSNGSDGTSSEI